MQRHHDVTGPQVGFALLKDGDDPPIYQYGARYTADAQPLKYLARDLHAMRLASLVGDDVVEDAARRSS